jgi:RNA polymerase sigma factor (sigma-70 family)
VRMMGAMTSPRGVSIPQAGDGLWDRAARAFAAWYDGTPAAMPELVTLLTPVLWHVARASRLDADDAADAVQATWLALVRRAGAITEPAAVPAWLITTVRREALRRSRTHREVGLPDAVLDSAAAPQAGPAEQVTEHDEHRRLWAAVRTLSERCQELLRVVAFEQRPDYAAISTRLGMPVGSIGPTRARCLDKLRAALAGSAT